MLRRLALSALGVVLTATMLSSGQSAAALHPTMQVNATALQVVVSGSVNQNGTAAVNARVLLRVWPVTKLLAELPESDSIDVPVMYIGTANPDGTFVIPLDPQRLSERYVEPDGTVSLAIAVTNGTAETSWNFSSVHTAGKGWLAATSGEDGEEIRTHVVFDLGTSPTVTDHNGTTPTAVSDKSPLWEDQQGPCTPVKPYQWHYGRWEYFARVMGSAKAAASITQTYGVDHTLGVGSAIGGWHPSGSIKISLGASATSYATQGSRWAWNRINYRDFYNNCYVYDRRPVSVYSILAAFELFSGRPEWYTCDLYGAGTVLSKSRGRNVTWSQGVNIGPISVSAQSGYNSETYITWRFARSEVLCGSTGEGWVASPEAQAG